MLLLLPLSTTFLPLPLFLPELPVISQKGVSGLLFKIKYAGHKFKYMCVSSQSLFSNRMFFPLSSVTAGDLDVSVQTGMSFQHLCGLASLTCVVWDVC